MASFTPDANFAPQSNQRDWAYHLGMMPQDGAIVFTKAGLISFLKTHNVEVGPNYTELSRMPKYATVGRFDRDPAQIAVAVDAPAPVPAAAAAAAPVPSAPAPTPMAPSALGNTDPVPNPTIKKQEQQPVVRTPDGDVFRPTRRVREPVGGGSAQIGALFGGGDDSTEDAAKESARRRGLAPATASEPAAFTHEPVQSQPARGTAPAASAGEANEVFRPTRRVREPGGTGGASSITLG